MAEEEVKDVVDNEPDNDKVKSPSRFHGTLRLTIS